MRISRRRGWLAAVAFALTVKADVNFDPNSFVGSWGPEAILSYEKAQSNPFKWTASGANAAEILLFSFTDQDDHPTQIGRGQATSEAQEPSVDATISTPNPTDGPTNPDGSASGKKARDLQKRQAHTDGNQNMTLLVSESPSGGQVSFSQLSISSLKDIIPSGTLLFFQATWTGNQATSRVFTLVQGQSEYLEYKNNSHFSNPAPYQWAGTNTASATPTATTMLSPSASDQSPDASGVQPAGSPAKSAGDSGLSTGAVIGIAVACGVVGLALLFGLVWCLLRRRQKKTAMLPVDSAYVPGNRAEDLMAEKEAAADVDAGPHSPYSDDGAPGAGPSSSAYQDGSVHGEALAAGVAGGGLAAGGLRQQPQGDQPRSFTPYSDRPSVGGAAAPAAGTPSVRAASLAPADEARVSVPSSTPGRATPRALTTPYAHLVEEGMTEEEIRRLEEEERQLDAAIEQAARR